MKSSILLSILLLNSFFWFSLQSQVNQQWLVLYDPPAGNYYSSFLVMDKQSNIYVTGWGSSNINPVATIKYNTNGTQQWVAFSPMPTEATCSTIDKQENIYVGGQTVFANGVNSDYIIIKYGNNGQQKWISTYNGPGDFYDYLHAIFVDTLCNVYVTGQSYGSNITGHDIATVKYDSAGVQQWVARYNGPRNLNDAGNSIAATNAGNVYITGYASSDSSNQAVITIKYNSQGVQQWKAVYDGPVDSGYGKKIVLDNMENVYVACASLGIGTLFDYVVLKYDSSGVLIWTSRYNGHGNGDDIITNMKVDKYKNVYVTGYSKNSGFNNNDYATIKYNSSGVQQWVKTYNGEINDDDRAYALVLDSNQNVYVTGYSLNSGYKYDITTIKYNSSGAQQWIMFYHNKFNSIYTGKDLAVDTLGNVYVTGYGIIYQNNGFGFITLKYSPVMTNIRSFTNGIPKNYFLSQNVPNPFNPCTIIQYELPTTNNVKLVVHDILGKEIAVLLNEKQNAGTHQIIFDGTNYPSGIYFYKLKSGNFISTKKMILIK